MKHRILQLHLSVMMYYAILGFILIFKHLLFTLYGKYYIKIIISLQVQIVVLVILIVFPN